MNALASVALLGFVAFACAQDHAHEREPAAASATPPPAAEAAAPAAEAPPSAPGSAPSATSAPSAAVPRFAGTELDQDVLLAGMQRVEPTSFKPVGSTATVFRARVAGGVEIAFKAATRDRPRGPESEIAAYRVARCLGLSNVPPAISREFPVARIRAALDPRAASQWPEIAARLGVGESGSVRGAAIHWIPVLADVGLDRRTSLERVDAWLRQGSAIEPREYGLAASISNMLGFDYVIGNFDRWSGANVSGNAEASFVYIRDHDLAFPQRIGDKLQRRLLDDLSHAQRFSRAFYADLQRFDRACLERELARDPRGARGELLSQSQIADVFDRKQTLVSHIASLVALYGESNVLVFE